jgi:RNA polymerase sigma factor (sigma-70 family)
MNLEVKGISQVEFDKVFLQFYGPIRNYIYYKTSDIQLSEDLAQDVFLKIWEKKEDIKPETVKALAYKIANNLVVNRFEHLKVSLKFNKSINTSNVATSPEFELEMKEFDERLQRALNELDEKKRTVFLMNRIDEFTYVQIAETLGVTVKAIEKRMEKALAFLRKRIDKNI